MDFRRVRHSVQKSETTTSTASTTAATSTATATTLASAIDKAIKRPYRLLTILSGVVCLRDNDAGAGVRNALFSQHPGDHLAPMLIQFRIRIVDRSLDENREWSTASAGRDLQQMVKPETVQLG